MPSKTNSLGNAPANTPSLNLQKQIKNIKFYRLFSRALCLLLIFSLLATPAPAASKYFVDSVAAFAQDARFAFHSSGWATNLLPGFGRASTLKQESNRNLPINRIQIFPGGVNALRQNQRVDFAAVAFDAQNRPLSGADFRWRWRDTGRGRQPVAMPDGIFVARVPGNFQITVDSRGRRAELDITVLPNSSPTAAREDENAAAEVAVSTRERKSEAPAEGAPDLPGDGGWNNQNWTSADDTVNEVGRPRGKRRIDNGVGSSNFTFAAPVVSLPGRGLDLSLALNYNSRLWNKSGAELTYDIDRGYPAPGWSLGFGKVLDMGEDGQSMVVAPDGTRHSFNGTAGGPSGARYFAGYTTDGSFINYYTQRDAAGIVAASVWFPNGSSMHCAARGDGAVYPTHITDRNGNYLSVTYRNNRGPEIETVTDTLGRIIFFNYDSQNRLISITAPGMSSPGSDPPPRTVVQLHYKNQPLSTSFAAGTTPVLRDEFQNGATNRVIDAIYYPATATGYWFNDADSYSTYGMMTKIVEQRAMSWSPSAEQQGTVTAGAMTKESAYNYPLSATNETGREPGANLTDAPAYKKLTAKWTDGAGNVQTAETTYSIDETTDPQRRITTIRQPHPTATNQFLVTKQFAYKNSTQYDGAAEKIETYTEGVSGALTLRNRTKMYWAETDAANHYLSPRVTKEEMTDERDQTKTVEYGYGAKYNQVTSAREYDYGANAPLLRETRNAYINDQAYTGYAPLPGSPWEGRHIFSLVDYTEVRDGAGNRLSHIDYEYDGYPLANAAGVIQFAQSHNPHNTEEYECNHRNVCVEYDPYLGFCTRWELQWDMCPIYQAQTAARGNVTMVRAYSNAQNLSAPVEEARRYDMTGNVISVSSSCCEQTGIGYTINTQFAYPETVTRGAADTASPHRITTSASYNYETGLTVQTIDANNRPSTTEYNTQTLRPTVSTAATGAHVNYFYDDAQMTVTEEVREANNTLAGKSKTYLNGLGLVRRAETLGAGGVWDISEVQYTRLGQVWKQSRPYRAGDAVQWSEIKYDGLGRATEAIAPDGSATRTFYNDVDRPDSATSLPGQTVRSQDAWGRERWVRTDALGRLVEVVEPNPAGDGSTFTAGTWQTKYSYDVLDNLTKTEQYTQVREFAYDSLSRLTRQKLAEQTATLNDAGSFVGAGATGAKWAEAFVYDNRSNLIQQTDARGVRTNYSYNLSGGGQDPLNRLQSVVYDTSGPLEPNIPVTGAWSVFYEYEAAGDKTRVKKVTTPGMATEDFAYDAEGRASEYTLTITARSAYAMKTSYLYDTLSRVKEITYPKQYGLGSEQRKIVQQNYDTASRLSSLLYNGQMQASDLIFNAANQVTQLKVGAAGANQVTESYGFDQQTGLLTNQSVQRGGNNLLSLSYDYRKDLSAVSGEGTAKTGNLRKITNNLNANKNREYEYDQLGRMTKAKGGNNLWQQQYFYDRFGNRSHVYQSGTAADGSAIPRDGHQVLSFDWQNTNRINTAGFEYDAAGNQTRALSLDGTTWLRYEYDAANRLVYIKNDAGTLLQSFTYGSSNARLISKDAATNDLTFYAWSGGQVVAEYFEQASAGIVRWQKSYVFAGDRLLSTGTLVAGNESIEHHHSDRLGTRIVTNPQTGGYFEQATLPFGTALNAESSGATNQRFTSYDRSHITGLDYAVNRHYDSAQNRFTQVDPIGMSAANLVNPQSLNLYAYVENDPVNYIDPSGLNAASSATRYINMFSPYFNSSGSEWEWKWGTFGGGFGELFYRWASNMWSSGAWSAEYSGEQHFAVGAGWAFWGGDVGGFGGSAPLLPGIHTTGQWQLVNDRWSWVITGFIVVHAQSSNGVSVVDVSGGAEPSQQNEVEDLKRECHRQNDNRYNERVLKAAGNFINAEKNRIVGDSKVLVASLAGLVIAATFKSPTTLWGSIVGLASITGTSLNNRYNFFKESLGAAAAFIAGIGRCNKINELRLKRPKIFV
jgi:RHS repeat-associated protein